MNPRRVDVAIAGAGIVGLAHAYAAARDGRSVAVFERSPIALGASIRNFGMIWPVGQPAGEMHQLALRSRQLWLDLLEAARIPYRATGSLHVVYRDDEATVAREFAELGPQFGYECRWLDAEEALQRSPAIQANGLLGALWSPTEFTVDPRRVIAALPDFLSERYNVQFHFGSAVRRIEMPRICAGAEIWECEYAIVCSGDDFASLYPEALCHSGLTRCKLQMLRTGPQPNFWQLGPSLASGLTLRHYANFAICNSLPALRRRIAAETPELDRWGVHILASQTADGELTLGDSHEYGLAVDIFDKEEIDRLIMKEALRFLQAPDLAIAQRWHGVYAKHPDKPYIAFQPATNVRVVTGVGGAGMTLSFGLAEKVWREMSS